MYRLQRSKSLALMFLLGAALVGGALGFSADRYMTRAHRGCGSRSREGFYDQIGLSPAQRTRMDTILDAQHRQVADLMRPIRPTLDAIKQRARAQIVTVLSPEQRARLDQFEARAREARGCRRETSR